MLTTLKYYSKHLWAIAFFLVFMLFLTVSGANRNYLTNVYVEGTVIVQGMDSARSKSLPQLIVTVELDSGEIVSVAVPSHIYHEDAERVVLAEKAPLLFGPNSYEFHQYVTPRTFTANP